MRKNKISKIGITGGGTGGHIYPLLSVCDVLLKKAGPYDDSVFELHYFGDTSIYANEFDFRNIQVHPILASRIRRYFSFQNFFDIPKFFISIFQALSSLLFVMPDVVFSKGGPGSIPVVFAAWWYRIPVIIHESDAVPGLANRICSKFSNTICVAFPDSESFFEGKKVVHTGNPIRREITENRMSKSGGKNFWRMNESLPMTLVIGGSQGSQRINTFVLENLGELLQSTQILHQVGQNNFQEIEMSLRDILHPVPSELRSRYRAVGYMSAEEMKNAMSAADVIVSRAGSGAIFEIASFGTPAILIPLEESAGDHQRVNAFSYSKMGGASVIEEANLSVHTLQSRIESFLTEKKMEERVVSSFFISDSAERIANEIKRFI